MNEERKARPPLIAIVGRPNTGKSTLFNRLTGRRAALTDDQPGVTRDRLYGRASFGGRVWEIVDTGGLDPAGEDELLRHLRTQVEIAVEEADAVLFLLDGKEGLLPPDHEAADLIRRSGKPIIFAVNKIDSAREEERLLEFYELGAEKLIPLSAEHGRGVEELFEELERVAGSAAEFGEESEEEEFIPRIAVAGRPNAGKSTLINALLNQPRLLVHDRPGTTRDAVDTEVFLNGRKFIFVDTAGMRRKARIDKKLERVAVLRALRAVERCHLALLVIDATQGITDQDAKIAGLAADRGRALIVVFNKWDLVEDKEKTRAELMRQFELRLAHVNYAPLLTLSALKKTGLGRLPLLIEGALENYNRRVGTGELNRALRRWLQETPPPSPGGKPLRIYYATQVAVRPPSFVFFANRPDKFPEHYKRYLTNRLRADFDFSAAPVRLSFRPRRKS